MCREDFNLKSSYVKCLNKHFSDSNYRGGKKLTQLYLDIISQHFVENLSFIFSILFQCLWMILTALQAGIVNLDWKTDILMTGL